MECFIVSEANTNLALVVEGSSLKQGAKIIIDDFTGENNQKWIINATTILSKHSGQALEVQGSEKDNSQIIQSPSINTPAQTWYLHPDGTIRSQHNFCLDITAGRIERGTNVIAYHPNNGINQKWRIVTRK